MNLAIGFLILANAATAQAEGPPIIRGGTVENGGNAAYCYGAHMNEEISIPEVPLQGNYYLLDYARAMKEGWRPSDFVNVTSWEEAHGRVERILRSVSQPLHSSFQDFVDSAKQIRMPPGSPPQSPTRTWVEASSLLVIQEKPGYAPAGCRVVLTEAIVPTLQDVIVTQRGYLRTVTREQRGSRIEYSYQRRLVKLWEAEAPLQYSMLLTHEWLWGHTSRLEVNQKVNVFLHSKEVERMTSLEIQRRLRRLGLRF